MILTGKEQTLSKTHRDNIEFLKRYGSGRPEFESRLFLKEALNISDSDFMTAPDMPVTEAVLQQIKQWAERRATGEPVTKILGHTEFWGLPFKVTADVLDPRPDSETIIESAVRHFDNSPPDSILDLGSGSGCLLVSLLRTWPQSKGTGVDISDAALAVAEDNAGLNGVAERADFILSDWDESIPEEESFDLIVANPPYIPTSDIPNLDKSVKNHDPILALDGGNDGAFCHKKVLGVVKRRLKHDGICLLEIGFDQKKNVLRLVEESNLSVTNVHPDLAGIPRVVEISFGEK